MIVELPNTTVSKISRQLSQLRDESGVVALGRVLTLLVQTDIKKIEEVVTAANAASRAHPARIIVIADDNDATDSEPRLDGQIRVGGDAGASEVIILRAFGAVANSPSSLVSGLLLPDAPIVVWWPNSCPSSPAATELGSMATRRITDSANQQDPRTYLKKLAANYFPGDGDMAWTRLTLWRSQLASLFDQIPNPRVSKIEVIGSEQSPSTDLLAAWLQSRLGAPVEMQRKIGDKKVLGIAGVRITHAEGELSMLRNADLAKISQTGFPEASVLLPRRSIEDCLIEELRFLGSDPTYRATLQNEYFLGG